MLYEVITNDTLALELVKDLQLPVISLQPEPFRGEEVVVRAIRMLASVGLGWTVLPRSMADPSLATLRA